MIQILNKTRYFKIVGITNVLFDMIIYIPHFKNHEHNSIIGFV